MSCCPWQWFRNTHGPMQHRIQTDPDHPSSTAISSIATVVWSCGSLGRIQEGIYMFLCWMVGSRIVGVASFVITIIFLLSLLLYETQGRNKCMQQVTFCTWCYLLSKCFVLFLIWYLDWNVLMCFDWFKSDDALPYVLFEAFWTWKPIFSPHLYCGSGVFFSRKRYYYVLFPFSRFITNEQWRFWGLKGHVQGGCNRSLNLSKWDLLQHVPLQGQHLSSSCFSFGMVLLLFQWCSLLYPFWFLWLRIRCGLIVGNWHGPNGCCPWDHSSTYGLPLFLVGYSWVTLVFTGCSVEHNGSVEVSWFVNCEAVTFVFHPKDLLAVFMFYLQWHVCDLLISFARVSEITVKFDNHCSGFYHIKSSSSTTIAAAATYFYPINLGFVAEILLPRSPDPLWISSMVILSGPIKVTPLKVNYVTVASLAYIQAGVAHCDVADRDWSTHRREIWVNLIIINALGLIGNQPNTLCQKRSFGRWLLVKVKMAVF